MKERPFRTRDRVIVNWGNNRTSKGRVICHNRKNKYGLSVVVLCETPNGGEIIETFLASGKRWTNHDPVFITRDEGNPG